MDWSFNEFYPDRKATALALAHEFRKEVDALVEAGCKIIQVDEPAVSVRADEIDIAIEAMQITTEGVDAYFITHALEYGYPETVFPDVLALAVDNFDMEFANSDFTFLEGLRNFGFDKDLSLGVVDVHTHVIDAVDDVEQRIRKAIEILPVETIWPDPDCGLKTRTVEESMGKMRAIAEATKRVRADLPSRV
jgi:5-methyltetrahydropteroyltriglutamate--homocysteine methyltransferase